MTSVSARGRGARGALSHWFHHADPGVGAGSQLLILASLKISHEGRGSSPLCAEVALPAVASQKRTVPHVALYWDDYPMVSAPAAFRLSWSLGGFG